MRTAPMPRACLVAGLCLLGVGPAAAADEVLLENGDVLRGAIVEEREDAIVLEHGALGRIEIPRGALAATPPEEAPPPPEPEAEPPPAPGLFGSGFLAGWERSFGLGLSGSEGNSETLDMNAELLGDYEDEERRWKLRSAYYLASSARSSSGRTTTKNQALAELLRDWLFPGSRWFWFAQARYDYDQFEAWDHRIAGSTGVGYDLVKRERFDLRGRLGAGVSQTFVGEERFAPEAVVGLDAVWRVSQAQKFTTAHTLYPDLSDPGEFRTVSTADWVIEMGTELPLSLKFGALFEHQSNTDEEENDLKYSATLLYSF